MTPSPSIDKMRADARTIFNAGLKAVSPQAAIARYCRYDGRQLTIGRHRFTLADLDRVIVIGAGKATAAMAAAMEDLLADRIDDGLICVKYDHGQPLKRIETIEAGHPLPDKNGVTAARRMLAMAESAGAGDLVIVLISGGGSALLPLPAAGLTLADKQAATDALIASGASIHQINALRKHLSAIKGGQLARAAAPAQVATLVLSDVVGDDLDVIASGPTVADAATFDQCRDIVQRYDLVDELPAAVLKHLNDGAAGRIAETPKADTHDWGHTITQIVGANRDAIDAARRQAEALNYRSLVMTCRLEGETREVARMHAAIAREAADTGNPAAPPVCLLSGGETTVTLSGDGRGGRNQEFALAAALDIETTDNIVVLSGGTDGTDGPTDAAGAIVDGHTCRRARQQGLDPRAHLAGHNAYPFFEALDDLLITGPTRTNVMDLHIALVGQPADKDPR